MTVRVVTDSTSDLQPDQLRQHGITMVPLNVHFGEEVYLDQVELGPAAFFEKLETSRVLPKTSQPSPGQFEEAYRRLAAEADEIVSIHISGKLSATLQSARLALTHLGGKPPTEIVDSKTTSVGLGILAIEAARMAREGKSAAEIAAAIRSMRERMRLVFIVDTLDYLQRGGRIGKAQAFLGTLVNIKPVLQIADGEVHPLERVRTRQRAIDRLVSFIKTAPDPEWFAILHDPISKEAERLIAQAEQRVPRERILVAPYGPVIGAHVGPGALGVAWLSRE